MDYKALLEKFYDLLKDLLKMFELDWITAKVEEEYDKIISNIKPIE